MKRLSMKRILFSLAIISAFINITGMEMPPQPMQAETTPIKTGVKRAAEETIAPTSEKAIKIEPRIPQMVPMQLTPPSYPIVAPQQAIQPLQRHPYPMIWPQKPGQYFPYQQFEKAPRIPPMSLSEKIARIKAYRESAGLTAEQQLPQEYYYDEENIEKLVSQGVKLHAPGFIILEPNETKSLTMADSLKSALSKTEMVVIASTAVFYRLLEAYEKSDEEDNQFKYFFIRDDKYNLLYQSPESNFVIFIPQNLLKIYQENSISLGINFEKLKNLSSFLNVPYELGKKKYAKLKDQLKDYPKENKFNYQSFFKDFSSIFTTKQTTNPEKLLIWDFIITGHGLTLPPEVAGLPIKEFNYLLTFFDKNLLVGTIIVDTCMAGGVNLNLLEFEEWGIKKNHPFIFIITATTDSPIHGQYTGKYDYALNLAAWVSDKGISLNRLLHFLPNISLDLSYKEPKAIGSIPNNTLSLLVRESLAIPQVWLPNGIGFQTYNIDQYILVINNVMARVAFENRKPIIIKGKRVVLLYPPHIKAPIFVVPWVQRDADPHQMNLNLAKSIIWDDMPMTSEYSFWKNIKPDKQMEALQMLAFEYPFLAKAAEKAEGSVIFPQFISMMRGDSIQAINNIVLPTSQIINPILGVIRFIRDAFLDKAERSSQKTFLIENLQGYNDISPLIQTARTIKGINQPHPLESILATKKNQIITLKNVLISTQFDPDNKKEIIVVAFTIDDTAWQFTYDDIKKLWPQTYLWNFTQIDPIPYQNSISTIKQQYQSLETGQKSISEVLQKKIDEIQKLKSPAK